MAEAPDISIVLGNHAHDDHMQADAMIKDLTGAEVMIMREDVPALRTIRPGGQRAPPRPGPPGRRRSDAGGNDAGRSEHSQANSDSGSTNSSKARVTRRLGNESLHGDLQPLQISFFDHRLALTVIPASRHLCDFDLDTRT